ncbi:MAG: VTT domain-containing protein [Verrucomicrobia bacterium]|nr:VTT domain-containing protein [Verrucomicrobiota bacterium]
MNPPLQPPARSPVGMVRLVLLILFVVALVSIPFMVFGEALAEPFLASPAQRGIGLTLAAAVLLAADSVAPVPATLVIMSLAAKEGFLAGLIGGWLGMTAGVVFAGWFGRFAVGRIAPRILPDAELGRLRITLQTRLGWTLACLRSVPVLAETSVIVAAAAGVPLRRIVTLTLLPNLAVSLIYAVAASDSFLTASLAFLGTVAASGALWLWVRLARRRVSE